MEPWVYDAVLRLLKRIASENQAADPSRKTMIKVNWFGGEPTLATDRIIDFESRLRAMAKRHNASCRSVMVSNGYLLSVALFQRLLDAGIRDYQITLDGDAENHDRSRHLKGGKPTFDVIYGNLLRIAELPREPAFTMAIRGNFLRPTVEAMNRLLDMFIRDFGGDSRFQIYFRPVYNFATTRNDIEEVASGICTLGEGLAIQNALAARALKDLGATVLTRMFEPLPKPVPGWCPAERTNSFIVGADGSLFLCDTWVGDSGKTQGRLGPDGAVLLNESGLKWRQPFMEVDSICLRCSLLPICLGGCKRARVESPDEQPICFWSDDDIRAAMRQTIGLLGGT